MIKPIFILGAHKSGTSLLRALFDGHPDLFVVPMESHFIPHLEWWITYPYRRTFPRVVTKDDFLNNVKNWISCSNESENFMADSITKGIFDLSRFNERIDKTLFSSEKQNILDYFSAIYYSIYGEELNKNKRIVEKSVENTEFALDLFRLFPDAYFLNIVRNPYANLVAIRKFAVKKTYPWLGHPLRALINSYYYLFRNLRLLEKYMVIKYEDLVIDTENIMRKVCNNIELEYSTSLLEPSFLNKPWAGNSTSGNKFNGISRMPIRSWEKEITSIETELINRYLAHVVDFFDYDTVKRKHHYYVPAKRELPINYLANRLLLRTG